jgi:hypothetical protein
MTTLRPEITGRGRRSGAAASDVGGIGHNGGPPLENWENWIELQRVVNLKEAAHPSGLSVDSIKRHHADKIIVLSPRRKGMRIGVALTLTEK